MVTAAHAAFVGFKELQQPLHAQVVSRARVGMRCFPAAALWCRHLWRTQMWLLVLLVQ